jgi:hypothetical protein
MNSLVIIWLVMRVISYALLTFMLVFLVGGHGIADTFSAMTLMKPGLLLESPLAFGIFAAIWLGWGLASWRFLFGK